jgi:hypothetical protein
VQPAQGQHAVSESKGWVTVSDNAAATYVGQVERDPDGLLWAVLYCGDLLISRERVRSLRKGKRRVADLVLGAADASTPEPVRATPMCMNRWVDDRSSNSRRREPVALTAARRTRDLAPTDVGLAPRPLLAP